MILHISHNDLDGVGCAILVKAAMPSVHTIYVNYDELEPLLDELSSEYRTVIITDIAPSLSVLTRLAGERELILIDHHISSEELKQYPFVTHNIHKSATLLTYEVLTAMEHDLSRYKNFVDCINDFDMWELKRNDSLKMNLLLNLFGIERFEKRFFSKPYSDFTSEESLVITLEEERRDLYMKRSEKNVQFFLDTKQRQFAVIFAEFYGSELGNYIVSAMMVDYVVIISAQRKKISLRSRKDVDISDIAVSQGGGGHKNAAGFSTEHDFGVTDFLKQIGLIR